MKRFNILNFIGFIILLLISIFFFYLLYTDNISLFLNPRMNKYVIFALVTFIALTINEFLNIFDVYSRKGIFKGILVFFILITAFSIYSLNKWLTVKRNDKIIQDSYNYENKNFDKIYRLDNEAIPNNSDSNTLKLNDSNYLDILGKIFANPDSYKDKNISIDGFIYRDKTLSKNEFVLGREVMTCCVADLQVAGPKCKFKDSYKLKANHWFNVHGKITLGKDGEPIIIVKEITPIAKPKNAYLYPGDLR